jgi:hypothetical protein
MYYLVVGVVDSERSDIVKIWVDESTAITHARSLLENTYVNRQSANKFEYEYTKVMIFDNSGEYSNGHYFDRD